jgi:Ca2+-binding RTX toxin-like protein
MTLRIAIDSIGPGNRIDLGNTLDSIFVRGSVTVASTDNNSGIVGIGSEEWVQVYGNVIGGFSGLLLGSGTALAKILHDRITIGTTGVVNGGQYGILISGGDNAISNSGEIHAAGIAAVDFQSDPAVAAGSLVNYGLIEGTARGVFGNSGSLVVINYGTISGGYNAIETLGGNDRTTNRGLLDGAIVTGGGSDTIVNLGTITGTIEMGDGNDVLDSRGNGTIGGAIALGEGDDTFIAGSSSVTVNGGNGLNTLDFSAETGALQYALDGAFVPLGQIAGSTFTGFANVIGSFTGANDLRGDGGGNALTGGQAADHIHGLAGADKLYGLAGSDTLVGGRGIDLLTGGAGADHFVFATADTSAIWTAADAIADFSQGEGDRVALSAIDANTGLAGDQAFVFIGNAAYHHIVGELHFYQPVVSGVQITVLTGDANGDGRPDFAIQLAGHPVLVAGDVIL